MEDSIQGLGRGGGGRPSEAYATADYGAPEAWPVEGTGVPGDYLRWEAPVICRGWSSVQWVWISGDRGEIRRGVRGPVGG